MTEEEQYQLPPASICNHISKIAKKDQFKEKRDKRENNKEIKRRKKNKRGREIRNWK